MDIDQPARPTSTLAALNQLKQSLPSQSTSSAKLHAFADVKPAADASNTFASIGNSLTALDSTLNASAGPPITGKTVATLRDYSSSFLSLANIQAGAKQASLDDQLLCYDFEDSTPLLKILRLIAERVGLDTHVEGDLVTLSASQVVIDAELSGKSVSKVTFVYNAEGKTDERLSSLLLSLLQDRDFRHVYVLLDDLARMDRQSASAGVDLFSERMRQVAQMETGEMLSSTSPFGDVSYNLSLSKAVTFFYGPLFPYISFLLHVPAALPLRPEFAQAWSRRFSNAEDRELLNHPDVIWAGLIPDTVNEGTVSYALKLHPALPFTKAAGRRLQTILSPKTLPEFELRPPRSKDQTDDKTIWLEDLLLPRKYELERFDASVSYEQSFADAMKQKYTLGSQKNEQGYLLERIPLGQGENLEAILEVLSDQIVSNTLFRSMFNTRTVQAPRNDEPKDMTDTAHLPVELQWLTTGDLSQTAILFPQTKEEVPRVCAVRINTKYEVTIDGIEDHALESKASEVLKVGQSLPLLVRWLDKKLEE